VTTVALTFDDGPYPETTPALPTALGDAPATFFRWGEHAAAIGNHTRTHPRLTEVLWTVDTRDSPKVLNESFRTFQDLNDSFKTPPRPPTPVRG
jgi:hypothetical protein